MALFKISNEALWIAKRHIIYLFGYVRTFTTKDEFRCEVFLCECIVITTKGYVSFTQN